MVPDFVFTPEMQEVRADLFLQMSSAKCLCGAIKDTDWPFCRSCSRKAKQVSWDIVDAIRLRMNRGDGTGMARTISTWLYDLAVDYLTQQLRKKEAVHVH